MGDAQGQSGIAQFVVFLDENHSGNRHLHRAMQEAGVAFEKHLDHFARGVEDTVWIPVVASRGWVVLTADAKIRLNSLERDAVKRHSVRLFYFARNDFSGAEMGLILSKAIPTILEICETESAPFAASIHRDGVVRLRDLR